jgi:hypothetical protein
VHTFLFKFLKKTREFGPVLIRLTQKFPELHGRIAHNPGTYQGLFQFSCHPLSLLNYDVLPNNKAVQNGSFHKEL